MTQKEYIELTNKICGEYLFKWIPLEICVNLFISRYFCTNENRLPEFDTFISQTKDFKEKIILFTHLVKKEIDNETSRYVSDKILEKYEMRNNFAHRIIEIPEGDFKNKKGFNFISMGNYKNSGQKQISGYYSIENHIKVMDEMDSLLNMFREVLEGVSHPPFGSSSENQVVC